MLYVDLTKLKITKDFSADEFNFELPCLTTVSVRGIKKLMEDFVTQIKIAPSDKIAAHYNITIAASPEDHEEVTTDDEASDFLSWVNTITAEILYALNTGLGRDREKRLDVPSKFKGLRCSMSALKPLINNHSYREKFNIEITYKDLKYYLCDTKEVDVEEREFKHSIDEAPELKIVDMEDVIDA